MKRRDFFLLAASVTLVAPFARAGTDEIFSPDLLKADLAAGRTVFIDFAASWCPSCRAQGRTIAELRSENPAYNAGITFLVADWDTWENTDFAKSYEVTSRGTLLILRGDKVVSRTYSHSSKDDIRAMLDAALPEA
jgi:thioredoxin 1